MLANFKKSGLILSLLFGLNLLASQSAFADANFQLSPNLVDLQPIGRNMVKDMFVISTGDEPVAVQIRMVSRKIDPDGFETNIPEEEDFLVYPPQMIVKPGQQQVVKVTWLGDSELTEELAYRAIVEQLPINLQTNQIETIEGIPIAISLTSTYIASVYVAPNEAKASIQLESAMATKSSDGKDQLVLTFLNQGNARGYVGNTNQKLQVVSNDSPDKTVVIPGDAVKDEQGTVILAGNKRQFILPWPKKLPVGPVTATFTTD